MSKSRHSSCRTSPTMTRLGRIRSDSLTSRRNRISPRPSRFGCLVCSATQSGSCSLSSNTSSHVITRSVAGIADARQLSIVVFPDCVPPATMTLRPAATAASRNAAHCGVTVPNRTSSSSDDAAMTNLRMLTAQNSLVTSGITTCRRLPSGRRLSTNGELRSSLRPEFFSIRSTRSRTCASVSTVVVSSLRPCLATKTRPGSLIQISSTAGSSR